MSKLLTLDSSCYIPMFVQPLVRSLLHTSSMLISPINSSQYISFPPFQLLHKFSSCLAWLLYLLDFYIRRSNSCQQSGSIRFDGNFTSGKNNRVTALDLRCSTQKIDTWIQSLAFRNVNSGFVLFIGETIWESVQNRRGGGQGRNVSEIELWMECVFFTRVCRTIQNFLVDFLTRLLFFFAIITSVEADLNFSSSCTIQFSHFAKHTTTLFNITPSHPLRPGSWLKGWVVAASFESRQKRSGPKRWLFMILHFPRTKRKKHKLNLL